jgi:hypothetical protein
MCLHYLIELASLQRARVFSLWEKEKSSPKLFIELDQAIKVYRRLVLTEQKMRFDLGFDEYRRGIIAPPEDRRIRKQVLDAWAECQEIIERDGIPPVAPPKDPEESPSRRENTYFSPLDRLAEIANLQDKRRFALQKKEQASPKHLIELNRVMKDLAGILLDIQNMMFDLGRNEYRRGIHPERPTDEEVQRQVWQACEGVEEILHNSRKRDHS